MIREYEILCSIIACFDVDIKDSKHDDRAGWERCFGGMIDYRCGESKVLRACCRIERSDHNR